MSPEIPINDAPFTVEISSESSMVSPCKFLMKPIKVPEPFDLQKSTNSENKNHDEKEKHSTCRDDEKQNKVIFDLTKSESYVQKHSTCKNDEKENVEEIIDLDNSKSYEETDKDVDDEVILDYVYNGGLNGLILAECNGIQCNRNGARTLMPHQWLDDEVVNIYTSYLNASSGSDSVYVTTYFSGKLGNYHRILHCRERDLLKRKCGYLFTLHTFEFAKRYICGLLLFLSYRLSVISIM